CQINHAKNPHHAKVTVPKTRRAAKANTRAKLSRACPRHSRRAATHRVKESPGLGGAFQVGRMKNVLEGLSLRRRRVGGRKSWHILFSELSSSPCSPHR